MKKPINKVLCGVLTGGLVLFNLVPVFASDSSHKKSGSQSVQGQKQPPPPGDKDRQNGPGMNNPGGQQDTNSDQNQQNGPDQNMNDGNGQGLMGGNIIAQVADILGLDESDILDELKDGKTLAEIAEDNSVSESSLLAQLIVVQTAAIDQALSDGKISDEQAEKMKEDLAEQLEKLLESTQQAPQGQQQGQSNNGQQNNGQQNVNNQQIVGGNIIAQVAVILGLDESEILDELKDGKTLAEIAEDNSVSESSLLAQLIVVQTAAIDQALSDEKISDEQAEKMKEDLAEQLEKMIESTGLNVQGQQDNGQGKGNSHELIGGNIIAQVADYLNLDESDILDELEDGNSLVDIAEDQGYTEAQLLAQLVTVQAAAINQALSDGKITSEQAEELLDNLSDQITKIVEQTGLKA